jgi:hypothetical protein
MLYPSLSLFKEPKKFIQVILACSLLPPERMGWDPTMWLCRSPITIPPLYVHSYDPRVTLADYRASLYDTHWVMEMPSDVDPTRREKYITVRALSMVQAECMSGSATIVWAVIKLDDLNNGNPPHKVCQSTLPLNVDL